MTRLEGGFLCPGSRVHDLKTTQLLCVLKVSKRPETILGIQNLESSEIVDSTLQFAFLAMSILIYSLQNQMLKKNTLQTNSQLLCSFCGEMQQLMAQKW